MMCINFKNIILKLVSCTLALQTPTFLTEKYILLETLIVKMPYLKLFQLPISYRVMPNSN